ncbi:helix-turn-helix domain-containing protein [Exiguobacterium flavidum]|uniref:helix-turn-helix domain-containing protein n=1 Tax=Exiguobacterium flavidum TaxID=2184695 RepID=UPI000DF7C980|nr:helix-turn-helix transcriptional regulator [Exiguobacterium flavidum]
MIGSRIKELRKRKRMTQTELSEGIVTKSMLSMVENGKAELSANALREIAVRLGVTTTELTIDQEAEVMKEAVEKIERSNIRHDKEKRREILQPFANGQVDSYWQGRVYLEYADSLPDSERKEILGYIDKAEKLSMRLADDDEMMMARISKAFYLLKWNRFDAAMDVIAELETPRDRPLQPATQIEFQMLLAFRAMIYYDHFPEAISVLNDALRYMKRKETFYRADEVHRLLAMAYFLNGEEKAYEREIDKALQYVSFTEDEVARVRISLSRSLIAVFREDAADIRKQLDILRKFDSKGLQPFIDFATGMLALLEEDIDSASSAFDSLWEQRKRWLEHSVLDQGYLCQGLLQAARKGIGTDRVDAIREIVSKFPEGHYKKDTQQLLDQLT